MTLIKASVEFVKIELKDAKDNWKARAKNDLNTLISNLSFEQYVKANYKRGKKYKKHVPYTLTDETIQAIELFKILSKEDLTKQEEEEIKGFLLPIRTGRPELLIVDKI